MNSLHEGKAPVTRRSDAPDRGVAVTAGILLLAVAVAYANTLRVPFLLDDLDTLSGAASHGHHSWLASALFAPDTAGTSGRPLLSLSFALNYAWSGEGVWSYHLVNLTIHALATLSFFGLVRRTLLLPSWAGRFSAVATTLGGMAAAVWALHPLQTEAVTYLSQRAESLAGLFYLLTLYGFVRAMSSARPSGWLLASVGACWCGMATKEVVVTAPIAVLLYDAAFVSGSLRESVARRWRYFAGLTTGWVLLGGLMSTSHLAARGVGFAQKTGWLDYAWGETKVVVDYALLAIWPHPLVFDYGQEWIVPNATPIWPYALLIAGSLGATFWLWSKSKQVAFPILCFFLLLAPTSSIIPVSGQPMAENRMYLALGALGALAVVAAWIALGARAVVGWGVVALTLATLTLRRNETYQSALGLWEDTLAKSPGNARAHFGLAIALMKISGQPTKTVTEFNPALKGRPDSAQAPIGLGLEVEKLSTHEMDIRYHLEEAIRLNPRHANAHYNLALVLASQPGRTADAIEHFETALRLRPNFPDAHNYLGALLSQIPGRMPEALEHYAEALRQQPDDAEAHNNLANALVQLPGRQAEALAEYEAALKSQPDLVTAHVNMATELAKIPSRQSDSARHYEEAIRLAPDNAIAHLAYAKTLLTWRRGEDALLHCQAALRIDPTLPGIHKSLGLAYAMTGRLTDAVATYQEILKSQQNDPEVFYNLGAALQRLGQADEAAKNYEGVLVLNPRHVGALNNLGLIWANRGETAKAVTCFKAALAINPNLESARTFVEQHQEKD